MKMSEVNMFLLDRIEEEDKEYYDRIFNEYKTAFRKQHNYHWTDEEIREHLKNSLEFVYGFKQDFVNELDEDDVILDNLDKFTEYFSENIVGLL